MEMRNNRLFAVCLSALLLCFALVCGGCTRLTVLSQKAEETVVQTPNRRGEDESDYAIRYTVQVRNRGFGGKIRAIGELYTPEGQFYREQVVTMRPDEVRTFVFVFTEPTLFGALFDEGKVRYRFRYEWAD